MRRTRALATEFLLVDDDEDVLRTLVRLLAPFRRCVTVSRADDACAILAERRFCGLIVDAALGGTRDGLRVLSAFRARQPSTPAMVFTALLGEDVVVAADDARARLVMKTVRVGGAERLRRFAIECMCADLDDVTAVSEVLADYSRRAQLSPAELATLHGALHGHRAASFKDKQGVPRSTYKWRVGSVLQKTGHDSLETLTLEIFWEALRRASLSAVL